MDLGALILATLVVMLLKIPIMIISATLIFKMYRSAHASPPKRLWLVIPKEYRQEFRWLHYSLIFFFISEAFCGVETWILLRSDDFMKAAHSLSSVLGMGFFAVGIYLLFNKKIIFYAEKKCVLNKICRGCTLLEGFDCKFNSTVLIFASFILLAVIPPFFVSTEIMNADLSKYALPLSVTNWYEFTLVPFIKTFDPNYKTIKVIFFLPTSTQILENRVFPAFVAVIEIVGMFLFSSKAIALKLKGLLVIIFGAGMLCYTYFELVVTRLLNDIFLGGIAHEFGEFIFIFLLVEFLTVSFKPSQVLPQQSQ
ncbi:MAG: hypothetical protein A2X86_00275 [Bdellovibrionales bacterium GWA2_49_15]|nr:MAG: hypothetical protein A2X86_00275 [Bdellovibrionales bacterium GWA2_49_15]HAZ14478.1 hypothetical protein [Bdellovibrionales bacterium]